MRVVLRILVPLLALALAVAGALVAVETVAAGVAPDAGPVLVPWPRWRAGLDALTWTSGGVRTTAVVVGVVGLVLLLVGLAARRHDVVLADPVPEVTVTTSPRSLARAVGHEVRADPTVVSASVVASARRVTVRAATDGTVEEAGAAVRARADALLERLPLTRRPRVRVSVSAIRTVR